MKRRVYQLPDELCERIQEFQEKRFMDSEVAAVRHLLEQALNITESSEDLRVRAEERARQGASQADIVGNVLFGHPQVKEIRNKEHGVEFVTPDGETCLIKWG